LVLVRDFSLGHIASSLLRALDAALAGRDYVILVNRHDSSLRSVTELWQLVSPALVVAMGGLTVSEQSAIELSTERFLRLQGTVPNTLVGEMQAEYLAAQGHKVLGYALLGAPSAEVIATERLTGLRGACSRLGLAEPVVQVIDADDLDSVHRALDTWRACPGLTAVAAHSDDVALMICALMATLGLAPGVDLAIIGVDDVPAARLGLTTVRINVERWASQVVAVVEALLDDQPVPPISSDIIELVRRTTA
jgi:DNA-binding LacI/PurR family transcriptional regulator